MPNDALDIELCHTIRLCWQNAAGIKTLKGFQFDQETLNFYKSMGMSEDDVILGAGVWGCGDSAARLCKLLVNDELGNYLSASDAIDLSDTKKLEREFKAMKMTTGSILARINVLGGSSGSGHSYIFLGLSRLTSSEPLDGHIYQTNIGCTASFDLDAWISDPKFKTVVNLEQHLQGLSTDLFSKPVDSYQQQYMLTGGQLTQSEVTQKTTNAAAGIKLIWRPVDPNLARSSLKSLRAMNGIKNWPTVAPSKGAHLTV